MMTKSQNRQFAGFKCGVVFCHSMSVAEFHALPDDIAAAIASVKVDAEVQVYEIKLFDRALF